MKKDPHDSRYWNQDGQYDTSWISSGHDETGVWHRRAAYDPEGLQSLFWVMRDYDALRHTLFTEGGKKELLHAMSQVLSKEVRIRGAYGEATVSLAEPDALRRSLHTVGQGDVSFSVRRLDFNMPAYYVSRVNKDWYDLYSLIVEDLYRSPEYPLLDERFARLMTGGHEKYFLRLSLFRDDVRKLVVKKGKGGDPEVDAMIYSLGRGVFQGAWHSDQRFAFLLSKGFDIPALRNAIELVYLTLGCDLSTLRRYMTGDMKRFFRHSYPNPGISRLLTMLDGMDAAGMSNLAKTGLEMYQRLSHHVNAFLMTKVRWQSGQTQDVPLWKPVIANVGRLHMIAGKLAGDEAINRAVKKIGEESCACIDALLESAA